MKNLFLLAKYYAMDNFLEDDTERIDTLELKDAFYNLVPILNRDNQSKVIEDLKKILEVKHVPNDIATESQVKTMKGKIEMAVANPRIDFSSKVTEIIRKLKKLGYTMKGETIKLEEVTKVQEVDDEWGFDFDDEKDDLFGDSFLNEKVIVPEDINIGHDLILSAKKMKKQLSEKIYGQDRAVQAVTDSIKNNILDNENSPKSTYLFLGPPATGKTYLSELIGENLENYKIKKFDMTQYHEQNGGELYGYPRGWTGYGIGQLTGFVQKHPKSIIVLDEFEKGANVIQTNLLSIFDGGYMNDLCGWDNETGKPCSDDKDRVYNSDEVDNKVDFRQTIFIITSNLGKELYSDNKFIDLIDNNYLQAESMIIDVLRRETKLTPKGGDVAAMVPELISRFSQANIVLFDKLRYKALEMISENAFKTYKDCFTEQYKIKFNISNNFKTFLKTQILSFAPEFDARRLKNKIGVIFFDRITDHIMELDVGIDYCKEIKISISKEANKFIKENINDDIENEKLVNELFRKNLTLELDDKFTSKNGVITYKINSCKFKKIKRIKDFNEDGLVFDIPDVSFSDIAGHQKAKSRLSEVIRFLKKPQLLKEFDIKAPKGMLLFGPPGTGKTLLAKAFANEADLPFISTTGTDLLDSNKTKQIFTKAKQYAPSIIFIDEIDALGDRTSGNNREIPINKLLSEMDGFSNNPDENIFVIAATNYKSKIDSAIIRPGRIELHIQIDSLDKDARKYFIDNIINTKPTTGKFDMSKILMYTAGMTGAQLELIGKESSLYCLRHELKAITQEILIEQINIIKYGEKVTHHALEEMLGETAYHEAGHAVISKVLSPEITIEQITVTPREDTLGFVSYNIEGSSSNPTKNDLEEKICVAYAGRVAQMKEYGKKGLDSGASSDLEHATKLAYYSIAHLGMDEEVGYINISGIPNLQKARLGLTDTNIFSKDIEVSVQKMLKRLKIETEDLVSKHWVKIDKLAKLLLEKEVVYEDELNKIMK